MVGVGIQQTLRIFLGAFVVALHVASFDVDTQTFQILYRLYVVKIVGCVLRIVKHCRVACIVEVGRRIVVVKLVVEVDKQRFVGVNCTFVLQSYRSVRFTKLHYAFQSGKIFRQLHAIGVEGVRKTVLLFCKAVHVNGIGAVLRLAQTHDAVYHAFVTVHL